MNNFILIIIFYFNLIQISSFASEISSIQYLPTKGTKTIELNYQIRSEENAVNSYVTDTILLDFYKVETKVKSNILRVGYSPVENLFVQFSNQIFFNDTSKTTYQSGSTVNGYSLTRSSNGLGNPTLLLKFRKKVNIFNDFWFWDTSFSHTFDTGDRKFASTNKHGNKKLGSNVSTLILELGSKEKALLDFALHLGWSYITSSEGVDLFDDSNVIIDKNIMTMLGAIAQKEISNSSFLEFSLKNKTRSDYKITNLGNSTMVKQRNATILGLVYKITFLKNMLLWSIGYSIEYEDYQMETPALRMKVNDSNSEYFSGVRYQF